MLRRLLALLVAIGVACGSLLPALPAGAANDLQVTVRPGFDGTVRAGNWVPVEIDLSNSGPSLSGNAELTVDRRPQTQNGANGPSVDYTVPITVPEHSSKRFSTAIYVPPFYDEIQVRLVSSGQTLYRQSFPLQRVDPNQVACGVLSTDPTAFDSLNGLVLGDGRRQPHIISMDLPDLPTNPQVLASLDCLIISDYSTRGMTPLQQSALSTWVDNGGVLTVGTGASGQATLDGLPPDLLPAKMDGTAALRTLNGMADYFGGAADPTGPWLVANLKLNDGASVVSDESQPLVVSARRGKGVIFELAFSLTQKPLRGWSGLSHVWSYMLSYVPISASLFSSYYRQEYGWGRTPRDALTRSGSSVDIDSRRLLLAMMAFGLIVGPLNFLLFSRLGRRELVLVSIPLLAAGATAGALVYASHHQQGDVVMNQVSIVRTWDGRGTGEMHSFVGVYALHPQAVRVEIPANALLSSSYFPVQGGANRAIPTIRVVDGGAPEVQGLDVQSGSLSSFTLDSHLREPGQVRSSLVLSSDELKGQVTNGLPVTLRDAAVIAGSDVQSLGDLRPGGTPSVTLHLRPSSPVGQADLNPVLDRLYPPPGKSLSRPRGLQYDILSAALNPSLSFGGQVELSGVNLIGWIDQPVQTVKDPTTDRGAQQQLLFITNLPIGMGAQPQTIPAQLIERQLLTSSYSARVDTTGVIVNAGDVAAFQYDVPVDPAHFSLRSLNLVSSIDVPVSGVLELFNWRTGAWEEVPYAAGNLAIPNPERYFSATGTVRLRFHYKPTPSGTPTSITFNRFQLLVNGTGR